MGRASGVPEAARVAAPYDRFATVPEYAALRDALAAADGPGLETLLLGLAPPDAAYAIALMSEVDGIEGFLTEFVEDRPGSSVARTALAMRFITLGWRARDALAPDATAEEELATFRPWIAHAEQQLITVCAHRAPYAPAWGARVHTARALGVGPSEARRRYRHLFELSPDDFPGHVDMLRYLKGYTTDEEAHAFVRAAVRGAPAGSHTGALVALFHIERWAAVGGGERGRERLVAPGVLDELRAAAEQSVLHPQHVPSPIGVQAHSAFAMAYWLAGWEHAAAVHLRILGNRASEYPWNFAMTDPKEFDGVRAKVLRS